MSELDPTVVPVAYMPLIDCAVNAGCVAASTGNPMIAVRNCPCMMPLARTCSETPSLRMNIPAKKTPEMNERQERLHPIRKGKAAKRIFARRRDFEGS